MKRRTPYRFSRPAPSTARPPHQRVIAVLRVELYYHNGRMRAIAIILFVLCTQLGCQSYAPATLAVHSQNGNSVEGASVQAAPMYFFNPTNENYIIVGPYDILDPFPAKGDAGVTDVNGNVTLNIVSESPLELNVYAESFEPWKGQISISKQGEVIVSAYANASELRVTVIE